MQKKKVLERYVDLFNCKMLSILFVYFGDPIGNNLRKESMWRPIVEKMENKLSSWKQ